MKYLRLIALLIMCLGIGIFLYGAARYMDINSPTYSNEKFTLYGLTGALSFLSGVSLLVITFIWKKVWDSEELAVMTKTELIVYRFIGVVLFFIGFTGVAWAFLLVPFCLVYSVYLLRFTKRHFVFDLLFTVIFLLPYLLTIPFFGPAATYIRMFALSADWGDYTSWLMGLSLITKALLVGSAFSLFFTDLIRPLQPLQNFTRKVRGSVYILLAVTIVLLIGPLFRPIYPGYGNPPSGWGSSGCPPSSETIKFDPQQVFARHDENGNWVYQLDAQTYSKGDAAIIKIVGQKPLNGLFSRKEIIAPPFGDNIVISPGQKYYENIVIPAGKDFTLQIISSEPIYQLAITSKNNCKNSYNFLTFDQVEESLVIMGEKINPGLQIVLNTNFPPGEDKTGKIEFKSGELFYTNEIGLPKGAFYGYRVIDASGKPESFLMQNRLNTAKYGEGMEGGGVFNSNSNSLKAGSYTIQLIQMIDGDAYIVSKKDFRVYD